MTNDSAKMSDPQSKPRYSWPWFVLAAVLLAIALAVLWMSKEVARARRIRELNSPAPRTDLGTRDFSKTLAPVRPPRPDGDAFRRVPEFLSA